MSLEYRNIKVEQPLQESPEALNFKNMDYYTRLGISSSASQEEIKSAFHKLSQKYHTDTQGDDSVYKYISEAYSSLKTPEKRQVYDNNPRYNNSYSQESTGGYYSNSSYEEQKRPPKQYTREEALKKARTFIKKSTQDLFRLIDELIDGNFPNIEEIYNDNEIKEVIFKRGIKAIKENSPFHYQNFKEFWKDTGFGIEFVESSEEFKKAFFNQIVSCVGKYDIKFFVYNLEERRKECPKIIEALNILSAPELINAIKKEAKIQEKKGVNIEEYLGSWREIGVQI